jgi:ubiquinone/menaquinone biosynthesis C-methylase UbiE
MHLPSYPGPALPDRRTLLALLAGTAGTPLLAFAQTADKTPRLDVPYVPTPQETVDRMLQLAQVKNTDTVYDLGCGDGRIVITAAQRYGARGVGIDLNPERIAEAKANAEKAGVSDKVQFRVANLFETDVSPATVVTLYLLPDINKKLRPQLWRQLKPGTRVVSHAFDMGTEWPPERTENASGRTVYAWTIKPEHKKTAG